VKSIIAIVAGYVAVMVQFHRPEAPGMGSLLPDPPEPGAETEAELVGGLHHPQPQGQAEEEAAGGEAEEGHPHPNPHPLRLLWGVDQAAEAGGHLLAEEAGGAGEPEEGNSKSKMSKFN